MVRCGARPRADAGRRAVSRRLKRPVQAVISNRKANDLFACKWLRAPICSRNVRRIPNASNFEDQADRERPLTLTLSSPERSSLLAAARDLFDLARVL